MSKRIGTSRHLRALGLEKTPRKLNPPHKPKPVHYIGGDKRKGRPESKEPSHGG